MRQKSYLQMIKLIMIIILIITTFIRLVYDIGLNCSPKIVKTLKYCSLAAAGQGYSLQILDTFNIHSVLRDTCKYGLNSFTSSITYMQYVQTLYTICMNNTEYFWITNTVDF